MFERRQYRKFNAQQKTELVLAALKGHKSIAELARERDISEPLLRRWREQFLAGGAEKLLGKTERTQLVPALAVRQRGQRAQRPRRLQRILELVGRSREGGWLLVELGELVARRCGAGRVRAPTRERARHAASCDRVTCRHTNCLETPSSRVYADDNTAS